MAQRGLAVVFAFNRVSEHFFAPSGGQRVVTGTIRPDNLSAQPVGTICRHARWNPQSTGRVGPNASFGTKYNATAATKAVTPQMVQTSMYPSNGAAVEPVSDVNEPNA